MACLAAGLVVGLVLGQGGNGGGEGTLGGRRGELSLHSCHETNRGFLEHRACLRDDGLLWRRVAESESVVEASLAADRKDVEGVLDATPTPMATQTAVRDVQAAPAEDVGAEPERLDALGGAPSGSEREDAERDSGQVPGSSGEAVVDVWITIFACEGDGYCGTMANGVRVHSGAAACGWAFDLGRHFSVVGDPAGTIYECEDRGLGGAYWVDIWFWSAEEGFAWLSQVGDYGTVILR